jgi:hypothetical protein
MGQKPITDDWKSSGDTLLAGWPNALKLVGRLIFTLDDERSVECAEFE